MQINQCGPAQSWRLVHDGVSVLAMFESAGITETINVIFEAATEAECRAEISRLGLVTAEVTR